MSEYTPVELAPVRNVSVEWLAVHGDSVESPSGLQVFHGLPFQFGAVAGDDPFLVGFGPRAHDGPVEIPLGRHVRWIVFAHRLLESRLLEGEAVGRLIAVYQFRYANGEQLEVPIRERFEISTAPIDPGQLPLLAVPDQEDELYPPDVGPWRQTGFRQTEILQGKPRWYVLWAWSNPDPQEEVTAIRVVPQDRPFLVGAVTSSSWEEDPFGREPPRPVKISLLDEGEGERSPRLSVEVDRGVSTYVHPLPDEPPRTFLEADFKGWGHRPCAAASPVYVEIAARPSATVRVKQGEEEIAKFRWSEVVEAGNVEMTGARFDLLSRDKNWVHVTVLDDDTGRPVPCRVHFRSPSGMPYQPHGHHHHLLSDLHDGTWHIEAAI